MPAQYLLSLDQGTTGSRALLYDPKGTVVGRAYQEFCQFYPKPGWVEHDAIEIWLSVCKVIRKVIRQSEVSARQIASLAITNQRETTVLWDQATGKPVYPAIVWQDRRTAETCCKLKKTYGETELRKKTGLVFDPYFSATKIHWLLRHVPKLKTLVRKGNIRFGTMDSWILWNLTSGKSHATDLTNASRTLLFNIRKKIWDSSLLSLFGVPANMLPQVLPSGALFGRTLAPQTGLPQGIPIHAILGDQQAALYGQSCYRAGDAKNTYGTGCFVMFNAGKSFFKPPHGLLATLACNRRGDSVYALEGSIFIAGAAIQWLRDGLQLFRDASQTDQLIRFVDSNAGITVIPAFVGLGSPYWNPDVRGCISGITRGTTKAHLIRATLESVAHQTSDVLDTIHRSSPYQISSLKVDGGMTRNRFLMQFQSNLLHIPVKVSSDAESTAWGVAKLAGRKINFWKSEDIIENRIHYDCYTPKTSGSKARTLRAAWRKEIARLLYQP